LEGSPALDREILVGDLVTTTKSLRLLLQDRKARENRRILLRRSSELNELGERLEASHSDTESQYSRAE